jgi:hypothetical protein
MLFYAQKMPKKDLFAHASQYCRKCVEPASASARKQQHFQLKSGKRVRVPNERIARELPRLYY